MVCPLDNKTFGEISVIEEIAHSRQYRLYKARRASKFVVLKGLVSDDAMHREFLRREFEIANTISHPSIVNTLDFAEETPIGPAIIMEYIEGCTLDIFIDSAPTFRERMRVLNDILEGVRYLHQRTIYHNDLKPANIIVNKNGSARIIDFGLSISDDSAYRGYFGGSDNFTAPELLSGKREADCTSDIYSLGKIIELLFKGRHFRTIYRRCQLAEPSLRYPSIEALKKALKWQQIRIWVALLGLSAVALATIAIAPTISESVERASTSQRLKEIESQMEWFYTKATSAMEQEEYYEFAMLHRGFYYLDLASFKESLPEADRQLCDEIFAKQIAHLDSLGSTKPSITTLPSPQREAMIEKFNNLDIYPTTK